MAPRTLPRHHTLVSGTTKLPRMVDAARVCMHASNKYASMHAKLLSIL